MHRKNFMQRNCAALAAAFLLAAALLSACGSNTEANATSDTSIESSSSASISSGASDTGSASAAEGDPENQSENSGPESAVKNASEDGSAASEEASAEEESSADEASAAANAAAAKAASADASSSQSTELFAMDTVMTLTAYGSNAQAGLDAATKEINRLDQLFSISSETGDIYRANRDGEGDLSADSASLLQSALFYAAQTNGLFEPSIEPVMRAWGFTTKNYRVPSEDELQELLSHVDYKKVQLSGSHVKLPAGMQLDLGGIAKGYTSARVIDVFKESGVTSGIISLGGNVQALGTKPDGSRWRVGIQDPNNLNDTFAIVEVADEAVITSGTYQRYFEQDGKIYHHIIDPRTGYPSDSGLTSVSIISKDGTRADALSTSLFIMGADAAADFWKAHRDEFDTIMMDKSDTVYVTAGLADRCTVTGGKEIKIIQ